MGKVFACAVKLSEKAGAIPGVSGLMPELDQLQGAVPAADRHGKTPCVALLIHKGDAVAGQIAEEIQVGHQGPLRRQDILAINLFCPEDGSAVTVRIH